MAQLVEQRIRNAWVTSSSLVIGSKGTRQQLGSFSFAVIAQLVEQRLPKPQVAGSSPVYRSEAIRDCNVNVNLNLNKPTVTGYSAKASSCACRAPFTAQKSQSDYETGLQPYETLRYENENTTLPQILNNASSKQM